MSFHQAEWADFGIIENSCKFSTFDGQKKVQNWLNIYNSIVDEQCLYTWYKSLALAILLYYRQHNNIEGKLGLLL